MFAAKDPQQLQIQVNQKKNPPKGFSQVTLRTLIVLQNP